MGDDAVFGLAIIHHAPRWRDALAEILRVLRLIVAGFQPCARDYFFVGVNQMGEV